MNNHETGWKDMVWVRGKRFNISVRVWMRRDSLIYKEQFINKGRVMQTKWKEVSTVRTARRSTEEENILSRLRIGHTRLNNTLHLITTHLTGLCDYCQIEWVEHVMLHCNKYVREQEKLKRGIAKHGAEELSLEVVFTIGIGRMLHYLRETGWTKEFNMA